VDADVVLPPDPSSARRARRHVVEVLERAGLPGHADVAALLVSELVTNALLHARSAVTLRVDTGPTTVRVEVADASPRQLNRRRYSPESSTGRGLLLLEELASRWGVDPRTGGKAVWFELPRELSAGPAARRSA
jgi:anti-sigma regulatory factor (Ser/Thr protein kinase)